MQKVQGVSVPKKYHILTIDGYFKRVYEIYQDNQCTLKFAYLQVENELKEFGLCRYADYGIFREMKSRYFKKRKNG